jgi:hypothetical protein
VLDEVELPDEPDPPDEPPVEPPEEAPVLVPEEFAPLDPLYPELPVPLDVPLPELLIDDASSPVETPVPFDEQFTRRLPIERTSVAKPRTRFMLAQTEQHLAREGQRMASESSHLNLKDTSQPLQA